MAKTLKVRTEELLLSCLKHSEWIDDALYSYSDSLLDMVAENTRSAKELEALTRLVSKYATYLPPEFCSRNFEWTQQDKIDELASIKAHLVYTLSENYDGIPFTSHQRIKTLESFMEKIWRRGSTPLKAEDDLKDLIALRFIPAGRTADEYVDICYLFFEMIVDCLQKNYGFRPVPGVTKGTAGFDIMKFDPSYMYIPSKIPFGCTHILQGKDYIRTPKENGYQGLQISLYSPQRDLYIEVQVKTQIMFENSEYFESSHDEAYKGVNGQAEIGDKLFDGFDLRQLNNLHGFHSRDGKRFVDNLGLIVPRSF